MSVSFTRAGVRRGFLMAQAMAPGVALYGLVFGVLAGERGLSWLAAVLMSATVYSGSAQLAALQGWSPGGPVLPMIFTILVMNARYVLYGAAIQPWLVQTGRPQALASLFFLGDGNWALSMKEYAAGYRDAGFVFGSGIAMFAPWVLGTMAGHWLAGGVPDPRLFGLDFMIVAFAGAIGVALWRGRSDWLVVLVALGVAWLVHHSVSGGWYIVAAGLAGGLVGAWRHVD